MLRRHQPAGGGGGVVAHACQLPVAPHPVMTPTFAIWSGAGSVHAMICERPTALPLPAARTPVEMSNEIQKSLSAAALSGARVRDAFFVHEFAHRRIALIVLLHPPITTSYIV